eukprot:gene8201-29_t
MKTTLFLLALFTLAFVNAKTFDWQTRRSFNNVIGPRGFFAVDFATYSKEVRAFIDCEPRCDFFLLEKAQFDNLRQGRNFLSIQQRRNDVSAYFQFNDRSVISRLVLAVAVNPNTGGPAQANFVTQQFVGNEEKVISK